MSNKKQDSEEHEDIGLYQKLADRTAEILEEGRESLDDAIKKASTEISAGGDYTREKAEKVGAYLGRDLREFSKRAQQAGDTVVNAFEPHRIYSGVQSGLSKLLKSSAEILKEWAERSEHHLEFKTGEITCPGTLTCSDCGKEMHVKSTVRIPPCSQCHKTTFRKSY